MKPIEKLYALPAVCIIACGICLEFGLFFLGLSFFVVAFGLFAWLVERKEESK